jgi:hypothetical protein
VARLIEAQEDLRTPHGALRVEGGGVLLHSGQNATVRILLFIEMSLRVCP